MASTGRKKKSIDDEENDDYVYSAGSYNTTARLNFQYYLWGKQTGYQISLSIPLKKENLKIADLGTGTGIWLTSLSHHVPASAALHGFDLQTEMLPLAEWLPSNVKFHQLNVFGLIPEKYAAKFDVIHVRFLSPAVKSGDPSLVIKCAMKFLKPGGLLQWDERDLMMRVSSPDVTQAMSSLVKEVQLVSKQAGGNFDWIPDLDNAFKASGLEVISFERHTVPKEILGYNQDLMLQIMEEVSRGLDRTLGIGAGDRLRSKINHAYDEHRNYGTVLEADFVVCVGRKPVGDWIESSALSI